MDYRIIVVREDDDCIFLSAWGLLSAGLCLLPQTGDPEDKATSTPFTLGSSWEDCVFRLKPEAAKS